MSRITFGSLDIDHATDCSDFIANDESPPLHPTSIHWIIRFGGNDHKTQPKPKTVPEFKDALRSIWFALPENVIDNAVKDYHKRLQACVSTSCGYFDIQCDNSHNRYLKLYSVECRLMLLASLRKIREFHNKVKRVVKI